MPITTSRLFRCHYRCAVPGQAPTALFVQLRARDELQALQLAELAVDQPVDRVEPAMFPPPTTNSAKEV